MSHASTSVLTDSTVTCRTDERGRFAFETEPHGAREASTALWITHVGHEAALIFPELVETESGDTEWRIPPRIALVAAETIAVRVVDGSGRPAPGALVEQRPDVRHPHERDDDPRIELARSALRRVVEADAEGRAILSSLGLRQDVRARSGETLSESWRGVAPADVELRLHASFTAGGALVGERVSDEIAGARVRCLARLDGEWILFDEARVDAGRWGPVPLPCLDGATLYFRLEGPGVVPVAHERETPAPGSRIVVDFELADGVDVPVRVTDASAAPLAGAWVRASWSDDAGSGWARGRTDREGLARVEGCRPGMVWLEAELEGYQVLQDPTPREVRVSPPRPFELQLARAGTLEGRCTRADEPVQSFTVAYWVTAFDDRGELRVSSSEDGRFSISSAPLGDVRVFAWADDRPPSAVRLVRVDGERAAHVELELPEPVHAVGEVRDALTGEPVAGATVTTAMREGERWIPWGTPAVCGGDGRFEVLLAPRRNDLFVDAQGYVGVASAADGSGSGRLDLGEWRLFPAGELEVQVVGGEDLDYEEVQIQVWGNTFPAPVTCDAAGRAVFDDVASGQYFARAITPDGEVHDVEVYLRAGTPRRIEIPLDDAERRRLVVRVEADTASLAEVGGVGLFTTTADGVVHQHHRNLPPSGRAEFRGPFGAEVVVQVVATDGRLLGLQRTAMPERGAAELGVRLNGSARRLRVVDASARPLPGTWVRLTPESVAAGWVQEGSTDAEGLFDFAASPDVALLAHVQHASAGARSDVELGDDELVEIVLGEGAPMQILLVDGAEPLSSVEAHLLSARTRAFAAAVPPTDSAGRAESAPLFAGEYVLRVTHPTLWPAEVAVTHGSDRGVQTLEARRLGGLELRVVDEADQPLAGVRVDVQSTELTASVAEWREQGLVAGHLSVTDAVGLWSVWGVPHGAYLWSVQAADGRAASGEVVVPPESMSRSTLRLGD